MGARLIAVACAADRLLAGDPARGANPSPDAAAALQALGGTALDPDLVRVWLRLADRAALGAR
jgi:HD-GYP domain-containing protein (c-di-GMP phosphodiesterase class II)